MDAIISDLDSNYETFFFEHGFMSYNDKTNLKKALYSSIRVVSRKLRELNDSKIKR
jgi:hypothetical protein